MILPKSSSLSLSCAARALRDGKLVVLPTDTVYGFSALDTEEGAALIRKAKGRPKEKSFIRLIARPSDLKKYTEARVRNELLACWPCALTLVVPLRSGSTAAFRCPGDAWLRAVVAEAGRAVFSSSVNVSGEEPLLYAADIEAKFKETIALVVQDDPLEGTAPALPSTIIDASAFPYRVLRQGAVSIPEEILNSSAL